MVKIKLIKNNLIQVIMKKIFLLSLSLVISTMIFSQQMGPAISWVDTSHDFGTIEESSGVQEHTFEFVNTGNEPLLLTNVKPSCGCTSADYSREPIAPGAKGFVKAGYDPKGRGTGNFNKSITVTTNETPNNQSYLRISGVVKVPQGTEQPTDGTTPNKQ